MIKLVQTGRVDVNSLPPPSEEADFIRQYHSDVISASTKPVLWIEGESEPEPGKTTYRDVWGKEVTREDYEAYLTADAKREKPFRDQFQSKFK